MNQGLKLVGRELKASELEPAMVVEVHYHGFRKTVWVCTVAPGFVEFGCSSMTRRLRARRDGDELYVHLIPERMPVSVFQREGPIDASDLPVTDHIFVPSDFCDCADCQSWCHWHYGLKDVCLRGRHEHVMPPYDAWARGEW